MNGVEQVIEITVSQQLDWALAESATRMGDFLGVIAVIIFLLLSATCLVGSIFVLCHVADDDCDSCRGRRPAMLLTCGLGGMTALIAWVITPVIAITFQVDLWTNVLGLIAPWVLILSGLLFRSFRICSIETKARKLAKEPETV